LTDRNPLNKLMNRLTN